MFGRQECLPHQFPDCSITSMQLLQHTPRFSPQWAVAAAAEHFGLTDCTATELPSERDQNFLLTTPKSERFVLKVANSLEEPAFLEAQQKVLEHLVATNLCPRVIPSLSDSHILSITGQGGAKHFVRLFSYLPGVPMGKLKRQSETLLLRPGALPGCDGSRTRRLRSSCLPSRFPLGPCGGAANHSRACGPNRGR